MDVPEVFRFPFEPYPIQLDFMKNVYQCIEQGKLGIFESPTGTGKSLSLICGSLTWLQEHEQNEKLKLEEELVVLNKAVEHEKPCINSSGNNEPTWFTAAKKNVSISQKRNQIKEELNKINKQEEKIQKIKERVKVNLIKSKSGNSLSFEPHTTQSTIKRLENDVDPDEDVLIDDIESDEDSVVEEPCEEMVEGTKIIFASRTHSQISQFVREVKKSPFGGDIRLCSLASRQQLCINEEITRLKNSSLINEKCLEMQKKGKSTSKTADGKPVKKSKKSSSCPFLDTKRIQFVRDLSLVEIADIENLVNIGRKEKACPYYAARNALSDAQLIVVPYTTLLQRSTREACGLKLQNSVVVIDEAHNLLETISSIHNVSVWGHQLSQAHWQLSQYHQRFYNRLSAKNLLFIKQLLFFLSCLVKSLGLQAGSKQETNQAPSDKGTREEEKIYDCSKFCIESGFDHINIHTLVEFCEKSKLPQKLHNFRPPAASEVTPIGGLKSFLGKLKLPEEAKKESSSHPLAEVTAAVEEKEAGSPLLTILEFMRCLRNPNQDGRVLCVKKVRSSTSYIKYLLLNPGSLFNDFVNQLNGPRAVIVAGGTMQPSSEFQFQLFGAAGAPQNRVMTFSCGHVIPPDHVLPLVLTRGPSNKELEFSWANRCSLLDELANLLLNINQVVSGGVVCFLPSYDFENQVAEHLKKSNFVSKLEIRKKVFREPKEANQVDSVLAEYTRSINQFGNNAECGKNGALLFCVVGGKLSEGINFSDDLARCVVVVGLPYANTQSAALKEKMDYLNQNMMNLRPEGEKRLPGQLHYESLCFKAVNQSIGRAIRHSKDYAVLILADSRYARSTSMSSLPEWIAKRLTVSDKFGRSLVSIRKFLSSHK